MDVQVENRAAKDRSMNFFDFFFVKSLNFVGPGQILDFMTSFE